MAKEKSLLNEILLKLSGVAILFRNNTGKGWAGTLVNSTKNKDGLFVQIKSAHPLQAGLCKGSSDLIGWTPIQITSDMVGRKIAVFTALEGKTPNGKLSNEQANFILQIKNAGGIAGAVYSVEDAYELIRDFKS